MRILFVCMGNICRSPTAEGVTRRVLKDTGMDGAVEVDSAGTHAYHVGEAPDPRAQRAAKRRGIDLGRLRARRVEAEDFEAFDLILAMDQDNLEHLRSMSPLHHQGKLELFMRYARRYDAEEVPDPYYGGEKGFDLVLDMVEDAAQGLLEALRRRVV
jgi:protein-tyrosine phosphatase